MLARLTLFNYYLTMVLFFPKEIQLMLSFHTQNLQNTKKNPCDISSSSVNMESVHKVKQYTEHYIHLSHSLLAVDSV